MRGQLAYLKMRKKKYLIIGLTLMFTLNVTDIATTLWNDPTLKSEVNPWYTEYKLSPLVFFLLTSSYLIPYSLLFSYHAIIFKGYDFSASKKSFKDFLRKLIWVSDVNNYSFLQKQVNTAKSLLNILGFYAFCDYSLGKLIISIHNFMLAFLANNSTFKLHESNKKVDIYLNDSLVWKTYFGEIILNYNSYTLSKGMEVFIHHYYIECAILFCLMVLFFLSKYNDYLAVKNCDHDNSH